LFLNLYLVYLSWNTVITCIHCVCAHAWLFGSILAQKSKLVWRRVQDYVNGINKIYASIIFVVVTLTNVFFLSR
jgi:hypothetical protein